MQDFISHVTMIEKIYISQFQVQPVADCLKMFRVIRRHVIIININISPKHHACDGRTGSAIRCRNEKRPAISKI